eukprot:1160420-Pelagomonas_calceolata.AAC.9
MTPEGRVPEDASLLITTICLSLVLSLCMHSNRPHLCPPVAKFEVKAKVRCSQENVFTGSEPHIAGWLQH